MFDLTNDSSGDNTLAQAPSQTSSASTFHVPYNLNQQKQVAQLVTDSTIDDFTVQELDSARTFNIKCSTGFYEAVAKPAFASLSQGFHHQIFNLNVCCTVKRSTVDTGSAIPGLLLRFEIAGAGVHPNPAPLSVHLYNTQRKILVQGGAKLPDQST